VGYSYEPGKFTVVQGVPIKWEIDGEGALGCGQVLTVPSLGITEFLPKSGIKTINFTPKETGTIPFNCSMWMMSPSDAGFTVVPNTGGIAQDTANGNLNNLDGGNNSTGLNDDFLNKAKQDGNVQKLEMTVTAEKGFYPRLFTVKKNIPVELTIDDQVNLGGCMGTMVIPEFGIAKLLKIGTNVLGFTPTKTGIVDARCSMGILQTSFNVVD
jgi:plastocyanin domain-containing protein